MVIFHPKIKRSIVLSFKVKEMVSEGEISVMMYRQVVQNVMCIHVLEGAHASHVCVSVKVVFLCLRGDVDIFHARK